MKTRESGMPDEASWQSYFRIEEILSRLQFENVPGDVVEFGCGYGTFTLPAAQRIAGTLHALDIEPNLVALIAQKARNANLTNVRATLCDFVAEGTGLPDDSMAYAMLFNILHAEQPEVLLKEAKRVLRPGGILGIVHWRYDPNTPRGPSMDIRPRPDQCLQWALDVGFQRMLHTVIDLPPYHFGIAVRK